MTNYFKKAEIKEYFDDFINDQDAEWIEDNKDELHHNAFNTDYYIIGTHRCALWLEDEVFNVIEVIKEYEQSNFGEVFTDFSDPEKVVNMYTYIVGEEIVSDYLNQLDEVA
tara:strand:- start:69 stop:401 length:333 start_codon:yes stop_codon:yes gene_type:complete